MTLDNTQVSTTHSSESEVWSVRRSGRLEEHDSSRWETREHLAVGEI